MFAGLAGGAESVGDIEGGAVGEPNSHAAVACRPGARFGAQAFTGAATIFYNRAQRDELRRDGAGHLDMFRGLGPTVAAEKDARARWNISANSDWIGLAARAFYDASAA